MRAVANAGHPARAASRQTRARAQVGRDISSEGPVGNPSRGTVLNMGNIGFISIRMGVRRGVGM